LRIVFTDGCYAFKMPGDNIVLFLSEKRSDAVLPELAFWLEPLKIDAMRLISIYRQESNYITPQWQSSARSVRTSPGI
jgi:hypothetical protein